MQHTIECNIKKGESGPGTIAPCICGGRESGQATFATDDQHPLAVIHRVIALKTAGRNKAADKLYAQHRSRITDPKQWKMRRARTEQADDGTRVEKTTTGAPGRITPEAEKAWESLGISTGAGAMSQAEKDRRIDQGQNAGAPGRGPSSIDHAKVLLEREKAKAKTREMVERSKGSGMTDVDHRQHSRLYPPGTP